MIRLIFILFVLIFMNFCDKTSVKTHNKVNVNNGVFNPCLEKELLQFIKEENNENSSIDLFYSLIIRQDSISKDCIITISMLSNINTNLLSGYGLVQDIPIYCYIFDKSCSIKVLKSENLLIYEDLIQDRLKQEYNGIIDIPSYTYKIVNNDSLQLIRKISFK